MISRLRFLILQVILASLITTLWFNGVFEEPLRGDSRYFIGIVVAIAIIGLALIWFRRFEAADWISAMLVRIGVVGMQIGAVVAMTSIGASMAGGQAADVIAGFIAHIGVAFYVSIAALCSNMWLELCARLCHD